MEKIQNLIKRIEGYRHQKRGTNELIHELFNEINDLLQEIYPYVYTKKEFLLKDLNYIFKNKHKMILEGRFINDFSRDLLHFEDFLKALLYDYKLKIFIEENKNSNRIEPILLKCYEAIGKLFNFYLYFWSSEIHYIHRSDIEKILKIVERREDLLNEKFDVNLNLEQTKSRLYLGSGPNEYTINLDDLQIRIYMSGDRVGFIFMDLLDHSQIFSFLDSIKQKLIENERSEIYQIIEEKFPNQKSDILAHITKKLDSIEQKLYEKKIYRLKKIEEKFPECFYQLKRQLKNLNFNKKYPELSPNGELWLKIIEKLIGLLRASAKEKRVLRERAQGWVDEVKDMSPWTNQWLEEKFGIKHAITPRISDGHSDHFIDDIALEDKLLRSSEKINNDNLIEEKYKKERRQIKREGILSGFQILLVVDIRDEIKNSEVDAMRVPDCFKIFHEKNYWTVVFLFQIIKDTPSALK